MRSSRVVGFAICSLLLLSRAEAQTPTEAYVEALDVMSQIEVDLAMADVTILKGQFGQAATQELVAAFYIMPGLCRMLIDAPPNVQEKLPLLKQRTAIMIKQSEAGLGLWKESINVVRAYLTAVQTKRQVLLDHYPSLRADQRKKIDARWQMATARVGQTRMLIEASEKGLAEARKNHEASTQYASELACGQ